MTVFKAGDVVECIESGSGVVVGCRYTVKKFYYYDDESGSMVTLIEDPIGKKFTRRFVLVGDSNIIGDDDSDCI